MEIISESHNLESKELLPQVLLRIFSICKTDPNFPLKDKIIEIEGEVDALQRKLERQTELLKKSEEIHNELKDRVSTLNQKNYETKSRLLEELGSEI
jgi:vacuolar-type H+-ATPase subunit I/STV1